MSSSSLSNQFVCTPGLVSILIPAHNEEAWISPLIEALLLQDYPSIEIFLIDNASTDKTHKIAQTFPIHVLQEERKGTNSALECGRLEARGEFIARIDADCIPQKDWVSQAVSYFKNPQVVCVTGPYEYYDASHMFKFFWTQYQRYVYSTINTVLQIFNKGAIMVGGNSMMRASDLQKIGGFDVSIKFYGDDTDLVHKLSKFGKCVFDKNLKLKSSARRFKKEGLFKIIYLYIEGFIKMTFRK
jgi:cellulose synthase/poly-beta-1,6-N-acetylglucosamine synthase-like glycosyltransferase